MWKQNPNAVIEIERDPFYGILCWCLRDFSVDRLLNFGCNFLFRSQSMYTCIAVLIPLQNRVDNYLRNRTLCNICVYRKIRHFCKKYQVFDKNITPKRIYFKSYCRIFCNWIRFPVLRILKETIGRIICAASPFIGNLEDDCWHDCYYTKRSAKLLLRQLRLLAIFWGDLAYKQAT